MSCQQPKGDLHLPDPRQESNGEDFHTKENSDSTVHDTNDGSHTQEVVKCREERVRVTKYDDNEAGEDSKEPKDDSGPGCFNFLSDTRTLKLEEHTSNSEHHHDSKEADTVDSSKSSLITLQKYQEDGTQREESKDNVMIGLPPAILLK